MLSSPSDIADLFSVFHDGEIVQHAAHGDDLQLRIRVTYLAMRIQPTFTFFDVDVVGVQNVEFTTWPDQEAEALRRMHSLDEIFTPRLQVLSGELEGALVRIVCNQPVARLGYSGGDLRFNARGAIVRDEAGSEWSIDQLKSLAEAYWNEWERRKGSGNAT
jgi:hypothetical protein